MKYNVDLNLRFPNVEAKDEREAWDRCVNTLFGTDFGDAEEIDMDGDDYPRVVSEGDIVPSHLDARPLPDDSRDP